MPPSSMMPSAVDVCLRVMTEAGEPDSLEAELVVDGIALSAFENGPLDLVELQKSLRHDGTYFIWTCWCGDPGCGGNTEGVEVRFEGERVHWHDHDMHREYVFDRSRLLKVLEDAIEEARRRLANSTSLRWAPERNRRLTDTA